ncbi:DNA-binding transcriptional MerR regulator [Pseudonocardia autotrophica]|uniref:DNA-binding transcriptional regulator, MerR family n=3 Tax=Pseudonocardia TaxID=1847 RepID=A0A1I5IU56_PSUAM|nr:HTH-type transcriptional regulator HmrR [Pseudonocardia autotrophica]TDN65607.1 DNA-binding transcriptional MerR regulator [Pseudonocardia autotrophica]SFO63890.1 DNA-binding transcriptional regulator, MerR family [Pseudonocardia ammonioxydans]
MQIGQVSTRIGLSLRTIRHWDEVGLVTPSARSAGGFRLYTETDVERLAFIKRLKPLDFSLDQIKELLATVDGLAQQEELSSERLEDLLGRLAMFRAATDSRLDALRHQVDSLESLSRDLKNLDTSTRSYNASQTP